MRIFGGGGGQRFNVSTFANLSDLAARSQTLAATAIHQRTTSAFGLGDASETADVELVSGSYFPMLGIDAALGRMISPSDDVEGNAAPVTILSDAWWRTRLGARPDAVANRSTPPAATSTEELTAAPPTPVASSAPAAADAPTPQPAATAETAPDSATVPGSRCSVRERTKPTITSPITELEVQRKLLRKWGCNAIQGYLVGRAIPAEAAFSMLDPRGRAIQRSPARRRRSA